MEFFASISNKRGHIIAEVGPYPTREDANAAAVATWPDKERACVSRNRSFDLRWINPRALSKA